jgi:hypothetical protein
MVGTDPAQATPARGIADNVAELVVVQVLDDGVHRLIYGAN